MHHCLLRVYVEASDGLLRGEREIMLPFVPTTDMRYMGLFASDDRSVEGFKIQEIIYDAECNRFIMVHFDDSPSAAEDTMEDWAEMYDMGFTWQFGHKE